MKLARKIPLWIKRTVLFENSGTASIGIVFIFGAIIAFLMIIKSINFHENKITENSPKTEGFIYDIKPTNATIDELTVYAYHYDFYSPNGHKLEGVSYYEGKYFKDINETVIIKYLEENPAISVIENARMSMIPAEFLFLPLIFLVIGLFLIFRGIFKRKKNLYLLMYGEIATAKIINKDRTSENNSHYDIEFITKTGKTCKENIKATANYNTDDKLKILYCPKKNSKFIFIKELSHYSQEFLKKNYL